MSMSQQNIEIILLEFDQSGEDTWNDIVSFTKEWNHVKKNKFIDDEPSELVIYFKNEQDNELIELENLLDQKHNQHGWEWIKTITYDPTKEEIENHDFIQIIGDGYPDAFLLNRQQALSNMQPCTECGTVHPHLRIQESFLQVNEAYLTGSGSPNDKYTPAGLDLINIDHGALLITNKVVELLKGDKSITGYTLLDVLNQNRKVSETLFQLAANKAILLPDNMAGPGEICGTCGTVLSTLTRPFVIKKERMGATDFFSRSRSGVSSIYISRRVYQLLKLQGIRALTPAQGVNFIV